MGFTASGNQTGGEVVKHDHLLLSTLLFFGKCFSLAETFIAFGNPHPEICWGSLHWKPECWKLLQF